MEEERMFELKPCIIAVLGRHRSGRSTVAKYLEENLDFHRISLDDGPITEIARGFGLDKEAFMPFYESQKRTMRPMVLEWGDMRRMISGNNYWLLDVLQQIALNQNVVVEDIKYLPEVQALQMCGARFITLDISPEQQLERGGCDYLFDHPSENSLDGFEADAVVDVDAIDEETLCDFIVWWLMKESYLV
jgi:hypothetical protein